MVENPEDPNELDKVYLKLTYIERRLDQLDKKYDKLREDYLFRGGRRKTRRNKSKKKRHIITRKNKRKRRRRTKKRRRGGMPKGPKPKPSRVDQLRKSVLRPSGASNKKFKKRKKVRFRPLSRSNRVPSGLNTLSNRDSPATKMFDSELQSPPQETQAPQLVQMMEDLSVSSKPEQQANESKQ